MTGEEPLGRDYVLREQLGQGAMGVVRRVTRNDGGPPLAAKLLRPGLADDRRVRNLFLQEEAALRNLQHESIVALRELVFERGQLALLMELVDGPNLRGYLTDRGGTLPPAEACAIAAQAAAGLAAAHAQGVIHLDLKPENILLQRGTEPPRIKIGDFGVAALLLDAGRDRDSLGGTPGYIAPEVLAGGALTAAADVFALGVVLVEMVTGARPNRRAAGADTPTGLPEALRTLVGECLAADPRERPTARTVAARLRAAPAPGLPVGAAAAPPDPAEATLIRALAGAAAPAAADPPPPANRRSRGARVTRGPLVTLLVGLATALVLFALSVNATSKHTARQNTPAAATAAPTAGPRATDIPPTRRDLGLFAGRTTQGGTTILQFDRLTLLDDGTQENRGRQLRLVPLAPDVTVHGGGRLPPQISTTDFFHLLDEGALAENPFFLHYDGNDQVNQIQEFCRNSAGVHVRCAG